MQAINLVSPLVFLMSECWIRDNYELSSTFDPNALSKDKSTGKYVETSFHSRCGNSMVKRALSCFLAEWEQILQKAFLDELRQLNQYFNSLRCVDVLFRCPHTCDHIVYLHIIKHQLIILGMFMWHTGGRGQFIRHHPEPGKTSTISIIFLISV